MDAHLIQKLSPRQMDICRLLVEGRKAPEIGAILSISPETVKRNIYLACLKLNLENRTQLIVAFARWQMIQEMNDEQKI